MRQISIREHDWRNPVLLLAGFLVCIGLGVTFGTSAKSLNITALMVGIVVAGIAIYKTGIVNVAFASLIINAVFLSHVYYNVTGNHVFVTLTTTIPMVVLVIFGRTTRRFGRSDLGVALIVLAQVFPAVVSREVSPIPGIALATLGIYIGARFANVNALLLRNLFIVGGATLAVIGLLQRIDNLAGLIPFTPMRSGEPYLTSRAVGLFNNPNTFGIVESMIIIIALVYGVRGKLMLGVLLCIVGVFASHSREALVGLTLALVALNYWRPMQLARTTLAGLAVVVVGSTLFPETFQHFDPRGFETDSNLLGRIDQWKLAREYIPNSPIIGYGLDLPLDFVDNAYLGWLLSGGVLEATIWIVGLWLLLSHSPFLPVLAVAIGAGFLGNPFTGPGFAILLILAGSSQSKHSSIPSTPREQIQ